MAHAPIFTLSLCLYNHSKGIPQMETLDENEQFCVYANIWNSRYV